MILNFYSSESDAGLGWKRHKRKPVSVASFLLFVLSFVDEGLLRVNGFSHITKSPLQQKSFKRCTAAVSRQSARRSNGFSARKSYYDSPINAASERRGDGDSAERRTITTVHEPSTSMVENVSCKSNVSNCMPCSISKPQPAARQQTWRIFNVEVHPDSLGVTVLRPARVPTFLKYGSAERSYLTQPVLDALLKKLRIKIDDRRKIRQAENELLVELAVILPDDIHDVRVVRRSLDARKNRRTATGDVSPCYTYVLDIDLSRKNASKLRLKHKPGQMELLDQSGKKLNRRRNDSPYIDAENKTEKLTVIIVGAGPAGLFCALRLARSGLCRPILLERGQPVESRGKDIGSLIHRRSIDSESNFAFGEGGAGTWSDGKLTTRIGRNSGSVRQVLETFVEYGAPETILVEGSPHLGTDNLVRLLRNMRSDLRKLGGEVRFGSRMTKLHIDKNNSDIVTGVDVEYRNVLGRNLDVVDNRVRNRRETILGDAVVLATGHSARDVYEELHACGVLLEPKGFAVGFRVEHPQSIVNQIQYGKEWGRTVVTGRGVTDSANREHFDSLNMQRHNEKHDGRLPVSSYRLATDKAFDGTTHRGAYSFCMCPGGQIVPTSTNPNEVCVNGMSFSKRDSLWANSALVVTVSPDDPILDKYRCQHGVLAGVAFQRDMERTASLMGGGNLTVPVQRLTDFVEGQASVSAPSSSYRLGVVPAPCHEIYPEAITNALRDAIVNHFEKQMPGFLCEDGLLHAVETRTSSPVRISRDPATMQAIGIRRLFPAGEGAGFAGGIVSAAVDGMMVADAVLTELVVSNKAPDEDSLRQRKAKVKTVGFDH